MGVHIEGEMHEYKGCSIANGLCMSIPKETDNRASKLSEKGEGDESDYENRESSSEDSGSALEREEPDPNEIMDHIESSKTGTITSGRGTLPEPSTKSGQGGVPYDPEGMVSSGEGPTNASAATPR